MTIAATAFGQDNLISSRGEDGALLLDPAFINPWGTAIRPAGAGGHWWIANTDTARVTLYVGDSPTVGFTQDGLSVLGVPGAPGPDVAIDITPPTRDGLPLPAANPTPDTSMPPSNPTGQVFSGSATDFMVAGTSLTGLAITAPSRFITVSEDGTIAAWGETGSTPAQRMDAFTVVVDNSATGAIYKGVTVSAETGSGNLLYAANFSQNMIEVYDADWDRVSTTSFVHTAPGARDADDYAPFNIERVTDATRGEEVLIVAYAKVANAAEGEEDSTDGYIVKYALDGTFIAASDGDGHFNAPWGVALAPDEWGDLDGALLVGNFGDGRILGLDIDTLEFRAFLRDDQGAPVEIEGLWDIIFGNGASLGATDKLYFTAAPEEESQGIFGSLSILDSAARALTGTAAGELLQGGLGDDRLDARAGHDRLSGFAGADWMSGGDGNDSVSGGAGADTLAGAAGRDTVDGGEGDDALSGDFGADRLAGREGDDLLSGGSGTDSLDGGDGHDTLLGGVQADTLAGAEGDDSLEGGFGGDDLAGGTGADTLLGGAGTDTLDGGMQDDMLDGGFADDLLAGGEGADTLRGGFGADTLTGGSGDDLLDGGLGADIFVFGAQGGSDAIEGFRRTDAIRIEDGITVASHEWVDAGGGTARDLELAFSDGGTLVLLDARLAYAELVFI
ncbi:TIGR03118 family protein [Roseomonas sp. CECT 9278]|uniref:TIGR03118 family protein n=1 Tax=Roseomonas sp. CECT 9278 TaxID=2845823 RepID=UPI001E4859B2|nr:TIGR03118 family protein [Roseomonas sp. CECT 9278]CAH0165675.1 hypothetical protein ROS9278_01071 [Roseomonas sp. CECT 9278]